MLVTHPEVVVDAALDKNLTVVLDGKTENLAATKSIKITLKYFGTDHYVKAKDRGYVSYVEGGTDVDMLHASARRCM